MKLSISQETRKKNRTKLKELGYDDFVVNREIEDLLKDWQEFVDECEKGYGDYIEEYLNDLDKRSILADVLDILYMEEKEKLLSELNRIDERFRAVVVNTDVSLWGEENVKKNKWDKNKNFWYFGYPKCPRSDFLDELKQMGHVK